MAYHKGADVTSIRFREDIRPLSEFRANTAAFIEQVRTTHRPIVLTEHGRSAAVLLDVAEYERLAERAEVLEDVRVAEEQIARCDAMLGALLDRLESGI